MRNFFQQFPVIVAHIADSFAHIPGGSISSRVVSVAVEAVNGDVAYRVVGVSGGVDLVGRWIEADLGSRCPTLPR